MAQQEVPVSNWPSNPSTCPQAEVSLVLTNTRSAPSQIFAVFIASSGGQSKHDIGGIGNVAPVDGVAHQLEMQRGARRGLDVFCE